MRASGLAILLLLAAVVAPATTAAGNEPPTLRKILDQEGKFVFTDGSSVFELIKGGKFQMGPVGISGRTIQGVWKTTDDHHHFTVTGKWEWVNGASKKDDYRRMILYVSYHAEPARDVGGARKVKAYPVYFTIDELTKISAEEYKKANLASP